MRLLLGLSSCALLLFSSLALAGENKKDDKKTYICHKGKEDKKDDHYETISVSLNAVEAHIKHGDYLGKCVPVVCSLSLVSDGSTQIEGGGNAVATWQHPVWIDPLSNSSFTSAIWIWSSFYVQNPSVDETNTFIRTFSWAGPVNTATLNVASDNSNEIYLNGNLIANNSAENNFNAGNDDTYDVKTYVQNGTNTLKIKVKNFAMAGADAQSNPAGLLYRLNLSSAAKKCTDSPNSHNDDDNDDDHNH